MYRFASSSKTPTVFLQQYKQQLLPASYKYSSLNPVETANTNDDLPTSNISLEQNSSHTTVEQVDDPELELLPQSDAPATIHLVKPIKISSSQGSNPEFVAGISGIELSHEYLKEVVMESTKVANTKSEFTCANHEKIWCYVIDLSGYILASNQEQKEVVNVGDFLGEIDPSLMQHLVENKTYFDERPEYNYAALCENPIDCDDKISAASFGPLTNLLDLPLIFLSTIIQSCFTFLSQLNIAMLR